MGMLLKNGIPLVASSYASVIKPPNTIIWPSSTNTFDSILRLFITTPEGLNPASDETSWKICILTMPLAEICGLTRKVTPTSCRTIV